MTDGFPHGTLSGYVRGCYCADCRAANAAYCRQRRAVRKRLPAKQIPHGLGGYNNYDCRCPVCTQAVGTRLRDYRARRP